MYLKELPHIKGKLQSSLLITLYSADAIPPKKRPRCALNKISILILLFYVKAACSIGCVVCGVHRG